MNFIEKKQPHKVAVIVDQGVKTAFKACFIASAIKGVYPACKVSLFSDSKVATWGKILGFDHVYTYKSKFILKVLLALNVRGVVIDLRNCPPKQLNQRAIQLLLENKIAVTALNYRLKVDAMAYHKHQNELINEGLTPKKYICFYNGYDFFEDTRFKNKSWPYEGEFINHLLKNTKDEILFLYDQQKPAKQDSRLHFMNINKVSLEKLVVCIEKSKMYFGTDTTLSLLASLLGVPTTVLQGPTSEVDITTNNTALYKAAVPCAPCNYDLNCKDNVCMKVFSPNEIYQKACGLPDLT